MKKTLTPAEIAEGLKARKSLHYSCKLCGTFIPANTGGSFTRCDCGTIAVDGTEFYTRLIGEKAMFSTHWGPLPATYTYRIKQVSTGLFYTGYKRYGSRFNKVGKFYSRTPMLKWVDDTYGRCVVEKYKVERVINK
jgi:hypothetical protein